MGSTMELTKEQRHFVEIEGHHCGKRFVFVLIDRVDGSVEMDYRDELHRTLEWYGDTNLAEGVLSGY